MAEQQNNRAIRSQVAQNRSARDLARAESDKARADAERIQAEALAERARGETERLRAAGAAEQARIAAQTRADEDARARTAAREAAAAEKQRREAEAAQREHERLWSTGMLVAPGVAGIGYGLYKAKKANAAHAETMRAGAPHLATLGNQAQKIMSGARGGVMSATARQRLGGTVKAAKDLGLMRVRTPIGAAGILVAEGLALRAGAMLLPEGISKELTGDIGTALTLAGGTMIASRGSSAKALEALGSRGKVAAGAVRGLASLNAARNIVRAAPPAAMPGAARAALGALTSPWGKVAVRGGALGIAAAAGAGAYALVKGYYRTDPTTGRQAYVQPHQRRIG